MKKSTLSNFEELALKGMKAMSEYLTYRGTDPQFLQRAKVGCVAVGAYGRAYAARTNRMAVKLATGKAANEKPRQIEAVKERKALKA